jgi:hypothetical protein
MAITKLSYPLADPSGTGIPTPVYNPVTYTVSSNNTAQQNFRYIADVYAGGATFPVRVQAGVDPVYGYGRFDFRGILKNFISSNIPTEITGTFFYDCTNSYNNFTIKFGEQYGVSSAVTNYPNLETQTGTVFNGSLERDLYVDQTNPVSNYILQSLSKKFLTSAPRTAHPDFGMTIGDNDTYSLYFMQTVATAYNAVINTYTAAGVLIQTVKFGTPYGLGSKIQYLNCGTYELSNLTGAELRFSASVGLPVISATTAYYTVHVEDSGNNQLIEAFRFYIKDNCSNGTTYRLCWLNKWGAYDQYTFSLDSIKKSTYKKDVMMKTDGQWSGGDIIYNSFDRNKAQYNTMATDTITVKSEWLTDEYSVWLEELASSPDVYYSDNAGNYYSIVIKDAEYSLKKTATDKLFNLELSFELNYNRYRQQA